MCDKLCLPSLVASQMYIKVGVIVSTIVWEQELGTSGDREWGESGLGAELIYRYICKAVINELQFIMGIAPDLPAALLGLQGRIFNYILASSFKQIIAVTHWLLYPASALGLCSFSFARSDPAVHGGRRPGLRRATAVGRGVPGFCPRFKKKKKGLEFFNYYYLAHLGSYK